MRERNPFILADLIRIRADEKPDLDVLTFEHMSLDGGATPDEVRTYADLQIRANRIAAELIARAMAPGDRFAIMMRNHPEFVEAMIAASITGCVFVPIDPRTRGEKLAFLLSNSESRGIFCADYCAQEIVAIRDSCPKLEWILCLESGESEVPTPMDLPDLLPLAEVLDRDAESVDSRVDDVSAPLQIIYTSGTTGDPKGIVGDHMRMGGTGMLGGIFGYQEDERPYTGLSFTHNNAQATALAPALMSGYRAVLSRRFTKSKLWDVCRRYGCTSFSLVGGMATAIYSEPRREKKMWSPPSSLGIPASSMPRISSPTAARVWNRISSPDSSRWSKKFPRPLPRNPRSACSRIASSGAWIRFTLEADAGYRSGLGDQPEFGMPSYEDAAHVSWGELAVEGKGAGARQ